MKSSPKSDQLLFYSQEENYQNYKPNTCSLVNSFSQSWFSVKHIRISRMIIKAFYSALKRNVQHLKGMFSIPMWISGVAVKRQGWPVKFSNLQRIYCKCEQVKQENLSWDKFQWKEEIRARARTRAEKNPSRMGVGNLWIIHMAPVRELWGNTVFLPR